MKKMRVSPDGLIQFALQMAYYSITKTFPLTYEAAITTLFNGGRTETIRTNNASISATVKEIDQLVNDTIDEKHKRDIRKAIVECIEEHSLQSKNAMAGKGFDRHLFTLSCEAKVITLTREPQTTRFLKFELYNLPVL